MINKEYNVLDAWALELKIVKKKKYVKGETIVQVKTKVSAHILYMNQKEYCDSNNIHVMLKRTGLEYTKKIRFLSGTYVKLASLDYYINKIIEEMNLEDNTIDIKKRFTYERNTRSKVLTVYAIEEEAKEVDEKLCELVSPGYKYVSYRNTSSDERLVAMYHNERKNIKSRYETLYNVNLKDEVWDGERNKYVKLEKVLMEASNNNDQLFLAVEQGAGKYKKDVNVVINPKTRIKSRQWLVKEYPRLVLKDKIAMNTSVIVEDFNDNIKYKESLKEFLHPTFENAAIHQDKKIGKHLKTYA